MELWQKGDHVVYNGDTWPHMKGWRGIVLVCLNDNAIVRFDEHKKTKSCWAMSLERDHNWKINERTLDREISTEYN